MIPRRPVSPEQALIWAEEVCSRAEYATGEIRERLIKKGLAPAVADKIITSLVSRRFIDDARFSRAFAKDKIYGAKWGKRKVAAALFQKRIPRDTIADTLSEIDPDAYQAVLSDLLRAKIRSLKVDTLDYDTKMRLFRFAAGRGFDASDISKTLSSL